MMKWILGIVVFISQPFLYAAPLLSTTWFANGQIGGQKGHLASSTTVNNSSGAAAPFNQDIYTINNPHMSTMLGIQLGHRWDFATEWITAFSLGAQYQYFFAYHTSGQVMEFSLPEFTNYNYRWQSASNLILGNAKLNLIRYKKFSPYVNGGLGTAYNDNMNYSEIPLGSVTPRTSPDYAGNSGSQFAYILGAGLDYYYNPQLIVSAGYQYSNLGTLFSGYGAQTWSSQRLNFGTYQSNAFLVGLTYLFDINRPYQK
jgi:opacity protein-like surface antigen